MKTSNFLKLTQWRNRSLRLLVITLIILSSFEYGSAQCLEGCRDTILWFFPVNEVRPHIIELIDKKKKSEEKWENRRERAWLWLEEVMNKKDMFCEMQCGVGCYFFYLAYAKLATLTEEEPEFARFLSVDRSWDLEEIRQNGCLATEFALAILKQYRTNSVTYAKELEKIDRDLWERQLLSFCPEPAPEPLSDLVIGAHRVLPNKLFLQETVTVEVYVKNIGDRDIDQTVWLNWLPEEGHTGFSKSVEGLRRNEGKWVTFDPHTFRKSGNRINYIRVNEQRQIEENNYTNNETEFEILVQDQGIKPPLNYTDLYITIRHPKQGLPTVEIEPRLTNARQGCVIYTHEFGLSVMRTATSSAADFQFFIRAMLPFLQKHRLRLEDAKIQLTGMADATHFPKGKKYPIPAGYLYIPGSRYSTKTGASRIMNDLTLVAENVELAYVRAYVVKDKLMGSFGLTEEIPIIVDESAQTGSRHRGARLRLCWPVLETAPVRDLEQLVHNVLEPQALLNVQPEIFVKQGLEKQPVATSKDMKTTVGYVRKSTVAQADTVGANLVEKGFHNLQRENLEVGQALPIQRIAFARNSAEIVSPKVDSLMREIAGFIKRCPGVRFEIAGHTTTWCTTWECNRLSRERAQAIYNRLKGLGTPMDLVTVQGYGKTQPLQPLDESQTGQEKNQRVEIRVLSFINQNEK